MKIALINTVNLEENGISTFILNNSYLFSKWGEDVAIIAPNKVKKALKKRIISKGIRLIELPMRDNSPQIYFWKLIKVLKKEKYDIVHVNGNSTTMSIELLAAWFAGIKVRIAHSHNTIADHTKINKLLRPIFNLTVNGRVACNIAAGKWLFHQKKFLVIRNGINLSHFHFDESLRENYRKTLKLNKDDILLGNVGRFNRQKNQVVLLDLIKQLGDNYYLVLVGSGVNFEKIKKRVDSDVFLRKHIFFTGAVSDTSGWLNAMDLFLLPSLYEGQPYTLIEATASGLDAVVSNIISSENDLVSNISFERLDSPKDWVQKIKIPIANNRELRSNSYCQKLKEKGYDTTENAKMLLKYYKKKISLYK